MELRSIQEAEVRGKRVLVRCGFDLPFDEAGEITDDARLRECLPTIKFLLAEKAKIILCGHNGRPKGKIVPKLSMDKVGQKLSEYLRQPLNKLNDCVGSEVTGVIGKMKPGEIVLLENLRFHKEEEENDPVFSGKLAGLADIYVNEAFANSHREHASMTGVSQKLPAYAGFRLQKEVEILSGLMKNPERPLVAIIGGAKISDKIKVIKKFLKTADHVLIGGALANNILQAKGISVGKSLVEAGMAGYAKELPLTDTRLHVPVDVVVAGRIAKGSPTKKKAVGSVADDEYILDIGPDTISLYEMIIKKAKTIVWGGPMGYFELKAFAKGTFKIARMICRHQALSVAGGGDTIDALRQAGCQDKISFVSTGGGAMLEFLEKGTLPAIKPLYKKG